MTIQETWSRANKEQPIECPGSLYVGVVCCMNTWGARNLATEIQFQQLIILQVEDCPGICNKFIASLWSGLCCISADLAQL